MNNITMELSKHRPIHIFQTVIKFLLDMFNPKRIVKYYMNDFKNNRISYAIGIAIMVGIVISRIGSMDFPTGSLFTASLYETVCGGLADVTIDMSDTVMKLASTVYTAIQPVGYALVLMYWLVELMSLSVRDSFSTEILAMHFAKLIIGVAIIEYGFTIISYLVDLGNALLTDLQSHYATQQQEGYGTGDETAEVVLKIMDIIRLLIPLLFMFIMGLISGVILNLQCISRKIKLCLYMSFAPLAISDLAGNEHSTSIRYMKTILALCLQGVILVAINYFAGVLMLEGSEITESMSIMDTVSTAGFSIWGFLRVIAVGCAAIGMYSKSEEISRAIVGL